MNDQIYKLFQKFIIKYANDLIKEEDILPHIEANLNELQKDIDFLVEQGGVPRQNIINLIIKKLSSSENNDTGPQGLLLHALRELNKKSPKDILFSVSELRNKVNLSKSEFDKAALELNKEGKISLHYHDHPYGLKPEELDKLIHDDKNNIYYVGIAIKNI